MKRHSVEQRVASRIPIRVKVEYEDLEDFLDDYTSNLSLGGMFVQTDQPLPVGTRFRLRLRLPDRPKPVETFGEVCWVVDGDGRGEVAGMGIRFDELATPDRKAVERMLEASG